MVAELNPRPDVDAELSVLGSVLLDPSTIYIVRDMLDVDDFWFELNREILKSMYVIVERGEQIDLATVYKELFGNPKVYELLERAGGIAYITNLTGRLPTAANIEQYIKTVKLFSMKRKGEQRLNECILKLKSAQTAMELETIFSGICDNFSSITSESKIFPWMTSAQTISAVNEELFNPDSSGVLSTGFIDLDRIMYGLVPGAVTIVAGRAGMGKTVFGQNVFAHAALKQKVPVGFFSLEMTNEELMKRIIANVGDVDGNSIRQGKLSDDEKIRFFDAQEKITKAPMYFDDTPAISISALHDRAVRMHTQFGIRLLVIDYIQLITSDKKVWAREQEVADISRRIKQLAKELHIPIICLAQINRSPDSRPDKRPLLSDLRESGSIEQDADNVLLLYREDYYSKEETNVVEVIIAKQRSGAQGVVKLHWNGPMSKLDNLEDEDDYF